MEPILQVTTEGWQNGEKMLEIKNFTKIYGKDKVAADHVNLTVESGDIFGWYKKGRNRICVAGRTSQCEVGKVDDGGRALLQV